MNNNPQINALKGMAISIIITWAGHFILWSHMFDSISWFMTWFAGIMTAFLGIATGVVKFVEYANIKYDNWKKSKMELRMKEMELAEKERKIKENQKEKD